MKNRLWIALAVLVPLTLGGGAAWYLLREKPATVATAPANAGESISGEERHTMGDPKAPLVLIEYGALTCPHCAEFNEHVMPALKEKYIDTGKVFYVYRLLPLGPADHKAEGLAACLPREKYFDAIDTLYRRQNEWGSMQMEEHGPGFDMEHQPKTDAGLARLADVLGLDAAKARSCMLDNSLHQVVEKIAGDGALRYGLTGVPTVIVNGKVLTTPHSAEELFQLLDPLLEGK